MSKVRVYELARDLKIESKILMNTLKAIGIQLPSHQSVLTDDQVDQLKKAISGEASKDQGGRAGASARTNDANSSVRVIRRRRGPDPAEDEGAAPQTDEPQDNPAQVAQSEQQPVEEHQQHHQTPPPVQAAPIHEASSVVETPRSEPQPTPVEPPAQSASAPAPQAAQAQSTNAAQPESPRPQTEARPVHSDRPERPDRPSTTGNFQGRPSGGSYGSRPPMGGGDQQRPYGTRTYDNTQRGPAPTGPRPEGRRPMSGGATIVRKASPEEIRARTQQQEQQQQARSSYGQRPSSGGGGGGGGYSPQRPMARREDSRGTKYTGFGSAPDVTPTIDPLSEEGRAARRVKEKRKEVVPETEEESLLAKKTGSC